MALRLHINSLATVRFLVIDHVAELGRLDVAIHALEKLVCAPSLLIDNILFHEAHVACVRSVSIPHALLDHFPQGHHQAWFHNVLAFVLRF